MSRNDSHPPPPYNRIIFKSKTRLAVSPFTSRIFRRSRARPRLRKTRERRDCAPELSINRSPARGAFLVFLQSTRGWRHWERASPRCAPETEPRERGRTSPPGYLIQLAGRRLKQNCAPRPPAPARLRRRGKQASPVYLIRLAGREACIVPRRAALWDDGLTNGARAPDRFPSLAPFWILSEEMKYFGLPCALRGAFMTEIRGDLLGRMYIVKSLEYTLYWIRKKNREFEGIS